MSSHPKIPPCRSLDIYRLVVVRRLKQLDVAQSFGVSPARISQVIRRVRLWVNRCVGEWLFPREDDLRFYVALEIEHIRVDESEDDPEIVRFVGSGWSYARQHASQPVATSNVNVAAQPEVNLSAQPINTTPEGNADSIAATSWDQTDCATNVTPELAHRLAQLLTIWKKSKKLSAHANRPPP